MTEPTSTGSTTTSATEDVRDRARDGVDHLQAAARELINAARAALDIAERLVDDPESVSAMVGTAGKLGDLFRLVNSDSSRWSTVPDDDGGSDVGDDDRFEPADSTVERITIR